MESESYLQDYGKKLLYSNPEIKQRKIGIIPDYDKFNIKILEYIIDTCNIFHIDDYQYSIHNIELTAGEEMKWHVDDGCFIDNKIKYDILNPKYSLIIYHSTYDDDFRGGKLVFADDYIVKPKYGKYILFNSKEVHKVTSVISGTRKCILVKFY